MFGSFFFENRVEREFGHVQLEARPMTERDLAVAMMAFEFLCPNPRHMIGQRLFAGPAAGPNDSELCFRYRPYRPSSGASTGCPLPGEAEVPDGVVIYPAVGV